MTTNQTIDGVPRELLEAFAAYVADSPNAIMRARAKELRALLDAPSEPVEVCNADNADQALMLLDFALSFALCNLEHGGTRRDVKKAQAHLEAYRKFKAAQAQVEPIELPAMLDTVQMDGYQSPFDAGWNAYGEKVLAMGPLYAEQPAPVAAKHTMRSIMEAVERSSEYTVLTSNQCAALAAALNTVRPTHANPPPGTEPSGTHPHNDGLDEWRKS